MRRIQKALSDFTYALIGGEGNKYDLIPWGWLLFIYGGGLLLLVAVWVG